MRTALKTTNHVRHAFTLNQPEKLNALNNELIAALGP